MATVNHILRAPMLGIVLLFVCIPVAVAAPNRGPTGKKLYRIVGADGKVYYTDQLPADAVDSARQELSAKSGMQVRALDRAPTPEERAATAEKAAADAKVAKTEETAKQSDQVLLGSYANEADLKRAYEERVTLQTETAKVMQFGILNQQQTLTSMLNRASNLELNGKPVNSKLAKSILVTRRQLLGQRSQLQQHVSQAAKMKVEFESTLEHYRQLKSPAPNAQAPALPNGTPQG